MSEEILGAIGKVRGLKVLARSSSFAFKGKEADPREIGHTIGADHLLEGSVRRLGDRIRISARLVQASDGSQLWGDRYDRTISDIFELQDEISVEVANQLRTALLSEELSELKHRHVPDREAHDLYIQGRHLWYRRAEGDLMRAIQLYERAIEIDPEYAEPHAGIAEVFMLMGLWALAPANTAFDRARREGTLAIELDQELASAQGVQGFLAAYWDCDVASAERYLKRAIELNPSAGHYHCWLSTPFAMSGRIDDCMAHVERAIAVEPMSPIIQSLAGFNMQFGDPEKGAHHLRIGFEIQPENPITGKLQGLGLGEFHGRFEDAIEPLEKSASMGWINSLALLASYHARLGNLEESAHAESRLDRLSTDRYVSPVFRAVIAAGHGRIDDTLDALEASVATGDSLSIIRVYKRTFEFVFNHPRASAILDRLGDYANLP
jgi:tetratricopeptide (TPR) repeat protein